MTRHQRALGWVAVHEALRRLHLNTVEQHSVLAALEGMVRPGAIPDLQYLAWRIAQFPNRAHIAAFLAEPDNWLYPEDQNCWQAWWNETPGVRSLRQQMEPLHA